MSDCGLCGPSDCVCIAITGISVGNPKPGRGPEPASPLPWRLCKPCDERDGRPCGLVWAVDGETQPCVVTDEHCDAKRSGEAWRQDGRFIVHACNSHSALLKFVKACAAGHYGMGDFAGAAGNVLAMLAKGDE